MCASAVIHEEFVDSVNTALLNKPNEILKLNNNNSESKKDQISYVSNNNQTLSMN